MVSFWPFKGGDTSAAGFEKILANLSQKINKQNAKDARLRSQQRRLRVLWTLYTGFAYLAALLILVLVVGRRNWDVAEYTGLAASPVAIYMVRLVIDTVYNYRINGTQGQLEELQKQRNEAIEKLKAATKYNSTQQLLEKYGGESGSPSPKQPKAKQSRKSGPISPPKAPSQRTGLPPPPTANIPQHNIPPSPPPAPNQPTSTPSSPVLAPSPTAEFAPNAFSSSTAPEQVHPLIQPRWYDRVLDAILGEDETQPRNRIALICRVCRLVNGQAPPGTRDLKDVGVWRCMACHATNGVQTPAEKALSEAVKEEKKAAAAAAEEEEEEEREQVEESEVVHEDEAQSTEEMESDTTSKATGRATRAQARQRKK
ncbi:hypothetical protein ANO11243_061240 [Dothideomycetidae sp. 11243]|nr:hypothetical protein ANO11243_061240 [fungal sp. No.11243]